MKEHIKEVLGIAGVVLLMIIIWILYQVVPRLPFESIPDYCKRKTDSILVYTGGSYENCVDREITNR